MGETGTVTGKLCLTPGGWKKKRRRRRRGGRKRGEDGGGIGRREDYIKQKLLHCEQQ